MMSSYFYILRFGVVGYGTGAGLSAASANERKAQGIAVGQAVPGQLLTARSADGANVTPPPYVRVPARRLPVDAA